MTDISISEDDLIILAQQDMATLAEWWCRLNSYEWPQDLPDPEPPHRDPTRCRRWGLMCWIDKRIGHRVISRQWNKDMTDEEHEDFWRGTFEGDADAKERHKQRTLRKLGIVGTNV